jgi:hypothetical protein
MLNTKSLSIKITGTQKIMVDKLTACEVRITEEKKSRIANQVPSTVGAAV